MFSLISRSSVKRTLTVAASHRELVQSSSLATSAAVRSFHNPPLVRHWNSKFNCLSLAKTRTTATPSPRGRRFSTTTSTSSTSIRPLRRTSVSKEERDALRKARKEQAAQVLQEQQQTASTGASTPAAAAAASSSTGAAKSSTTSSPSSSLTMTIYRMGWWLYVGGLGIPTALLIWGWNDETSPPAQVAKWTGLSQLVKNFADELSKPSHDKLLPDWSQMPNVPHDIPIPHTLVLDLEQTLVGSTWDRKYGWRHAKRPGVDKFLHDLAQYYEIVLYSPSHEGLAAPVVDALDRDGCIMHRLYREATHFHNGVHVKDLKRLNRDLKRMIVLDDDPAEVQFNPENLIRVKPYTDPADRSDRTLARITPFLIEIAREGYSDIPKLLRQYEGMDADEIADEQDRRLNKIKEQRSKIRKRGLGSFVPQPSAVGGLMALTEAPELPPASSSSSFVGSQLTAKDIAGKPPSGMGGEDAAGLLGFINRRAKEREEHQMRKMEKWTEVMIKKQKEREEAAKRQQTA
ncbi:hypothetical protein ACA910_021836 [Epithemia clementina (nom. ined.)]